MTNDRLQATPDTEGQVEIFQDIQAGDYDQRLACPERKIPAL
jgi:hypothetical protein